MPAGLEGMMFGLFRPRLVVDADELQWLIAAFAWMSEEFGGPERIARTALVLPAAFPLSSATGHAYAAELFAQVKQRAGLGDWPCDLIPTAATRETRVTTGHALRHAQHPPLGSFGYDAGRYFVRYNAALPAQPQRLIATLVHLLGQYVLHTARTSPPGGRGLQKQMCDLAGVRMGFGVFLANSARSFEQFQDFGEQGWSSQQSTGLSENALATALAMFVRLAGADARAAERELKDYLRAPFRATLAVLDRSHPNLAAAAASVDPGDWA